MLLWWIVHDYVNWLQWARSSLWLWGVRTLCVCSAGCQFKSKGQQRDSSICPLSKVFNLYLLQNCLTLPSQSCITLDKSNYKMHNFFFMGGGSLLNVIDSLTVYYQNMLSVQELSWLNKTISPSIGRHLPFVCLHLISHDTLCSSSYPTHEKQWHFYSNRRFSTMEEPQHNTGSSRQDSLTERQENGSSFTLGRVMSIPSVHWAIFKILRSLVILMK